MAIPGGSAHYFGLIVRDVRFNVVLIMRNTTANAITQHQALWCLKRITRWEDSDKQARVSTREYSAAWKEVYLVVTGIARQDRRRFANLLLAEANRPRLKR